MVTLSDPKTNIPVAPEDVYTPDVLHLLCLPTSRSPLPLALPSSLAAAAQKAPATEVEDEEGVVPMDLASSPSLHRVPEATGENIQHPSTPPQVEPSAEPIKKLVH